MSLLVYRIYAFKISIVWDMAQDTEAEVFIKKSEISLSK